MDELSVINVGIVGHIDHGKTTLLQRLTGKWASLHSEELKRGITIKLGYADIILYEEKGEYNKEGKGKAIRRISFVDAPGHEMLMATMLSGAALIDAAILVVAANEGIKPQTLEHLMALKAKNVEHLIVVQNKIDLTDKVKAKKNYEDIKKLLKGRYDGAPIIPVSAQQGVNLNLLYGALAEIKEPKRDLSSKPLFIVARSFDINRPGTKPNDLKGTVLGGVLKRGVLRKGDIIEIKPGRLVKEANQQYYKSLRAKIIALHRMSSEVEELKAGGSASVETSLDMAIGKRDLLSGNVVSIEGALPEPVNELRFKFELFDEIYGSFGKMGVEPIKPSEMLMLSVNSSITGGVVKYIKEKEIEINLKIPLVCEKGDNISLARNIAGHWRLIGKGEII